MKRLVLIGAVGAFVVALFFISFFYKDGFRNGYAEALSDTAKCLERDLDFSDCMAEQIP